MEIIRIYKEQIRKESNTENDKNERREAKKTCRKKKAHDLKVLEGVEEGNTRNSFIHSLACAECDDSLLFSGASSILLCCVLLPSTQFPQLVFHHSSLRLAIYFLAYFSALLFPNSYLKLFLGILLSSILCTCPNQCSLFSLIVSSTVGFLTFA